jgi:uncharacterized protein YcbX
MRITGLHTYPVKGGHRLDHDAAQVEPCGLAGDRRWLVVDPDGVGITQRQSPRLTGLHVTPRPGGLLLGGPHVTSRPGGLVLDGTVDVDEPVDGPKETVRVFASKPPVTARLAAGATEFLTALLDRPARLVWLSDPTARPIASHAEPDDRVSFADGFPLLLATTASLDAVNDWLLETGDEPVPMTRFRPNVVVSGARPWAEDDWPGHRLRLGDTTFRAAKLSSRCVVTTIDQETGETGRQPLRILARHRRRDGAVLFGLNLIPEIPAGETGIIRVGDPVLRLS